MNAYSCDSARGMADPHFKKLLPSSALCVTSDSLWYKFGRQISNLEEVVFYGLRGRRHSEANNTYRHERIRYRKGIVSKLPQEFTKKKQIYPLSKFLNNIGSVNYF